jgi:hypothetical protein
MLTRGLASNYVLTSQQQGQQYGILKLDCETNYFMSVS